MDQAPAKFDWIAWYATTPGIPAGWGEPPAALASALAQAAPLPLQDPTWAAVAEPELLAA